MTRTRHVVLALLLVACSKKEDAPSSPAPSPSQPSPKTAPGPSSTPAAAPTKPPTPSAGPRGRAATGNNAALVELATKNVGCKLDASFPKNSCNDQVKAFLAAFDPAKDAATLANLVEDSEPAIRFLVVRVLLDKLLLQTAPARAFQARFAAAASAETEPATAALFGEVLLHGDFKDAAYATAVGTMFERHALPAMRASIASNLAVQDPPDRWVPAMIARYGAETDRTVKVAIVSGMYLAKDAAKVCPFLLDVMKDSDNELAGTAGYGLVWSDGKCKDHYDAFLAAYAAHIAATKPDYAFVLKVMYMAKAKGATAEQKTKFNETSKAIIADATVSGMARAKVLETIGDKAYARSFVADKDSSVAEAAKRIAK